jgi:putative two-component system response regulator
VLQRLAATCEFRDDDTGKHTRRIRQLSGLLARELGLEEREIELIEQASPLHDVGKIGISDNILLKPGKLTYEEFEVMKTHTRIGASILSGGRSELVRLAYDIALSHHERWDGSGYPNGLSGNDIPVAARIVAVVDVFDALTHERPYKKAWAVEDALGEIEKQSGEHFDPAIASAFLELSLRGSIDL